MDHGGFAEPHILRRVGRDLLKEFLGRFASGALEKRLKLPEDDLPDDAYYKGIADLIVTPEDLPDPLNEALHAMKDLATPEEHQRLREAVRAAGIDLEFPDAAAKDTVTPEEYALRVWLQAPELVARHYNENRLDRLSRFDYFVKNSDAMTWGNAWPESIDSMEMLVKRLDDWCADNGRGEETVVVDRYDRHGEEWYLIRHGDTYARSPKVERRTMEVLHYRPAKDDVVVYSRTRDELRINARTKGEKDLYRVAFGCFLHGQENYFIETNTYTLEPLRKLKEAALDIGEVRDVREAVVTKLEIDLGNGQNQMQVWKADNIYTCSWSAGTMGPEIPKGAKFVQASLNVFVGLSGKPVEVHIRPPSTLRLSEHEAADQVHEILVKCGIKLTGEPSEGRKTA